MLDPVNILGPDLAGPFRVSPVVGGHGRVERVVASPLLLKREPGDEAGVGDGGVGVIIAEVIGPTARTDEEVRRQAANRERDGRRVDKGRLGEVAR